MEWLQVLFSGKMRVPTRTYKTLIILDTFQTNDKNGSVLKIKKNHLHRYRTLQISYIRLIYVWN